jgi:hypothetical protein
MLAGDRDVLAGEIVHLDWQRLVERAFAQRLLRRIRLAELSAFEDSQATV